ncbi:S53 family peptidase [Deinococcus sonorensis]|uniref:S53 family peptidase n=2 Tax=Deinococcus sonorensis TaxID=309891 RepID=A0AAU7UG10_9DEIO
MSSDEQRIPLAGSAREVPAQAEQVGQPDPAEELQVTLRLRGRQQFAARAATAEPMTRHDFAQAYGTSPDDLDRVERFAHEHQLTVVEASAERRTVVLGGTVAQLEAAFAVQLQLYRWQGQQFRGRSGELSVPADLDGIIQGIFGLDDRPQARPQFRYPGAGPGIAHPQAVTQSFTPLQLAQVYNFPPELDGRGQTIAIIELGGGYRTADLKAYFQRLGVPQPKVSAVSVDGARNRPTGDPNGADGEVMLDIEVAGALAPGAHIAVYFAPNTDAGFLNAITRAVHDSVRRPSVISISWGAPENAWTVQAMQAMTDAFTEAGMLGVTVLAAAGDDGSSDRAADGRAHTDFPASSPACTGCGGTRLTVEGERITAEVVWNNGPGAGATGGGVSDTFDLPDYQRAAGVPVSANPGQRVGRGVPDVSGVADPQTGYQVRVDGLDTVIGGTSAVSPLWAGLVARLNQARQQSGKGTLGFLNPRLYPLGAIRDITDGSNGAYTAQPGWDACTGLGSPDGVRLLETLQAQP